MKEQRWIVVALMFLLLPGMMSAQYRHRAQSRSRSDNYHFLSVALAGGYSSLDENVPGAVTTGKFSGQGSIGYEFRRAGLWINVSGQLAMVNAETEFEPFAAKKRGADDTGDPGVFTYSIKQTDTHRWVTAGVPIMIGYYVTGFYFGFGAKVAFNLSSHSDTKGSYDLSMKYDNKVGDFINIPGHGYTATYFDQSHSVRMEPHGAIIGEIGYDLLSGISTNSETCHILKIGFYFEYGLNSVFNPVEPSTRLVINQQNATQAKVNPYFTSSLKSDERVAPYFLGVKLTYLFGGSASGRTGTWHRGCQCYQN